MLKLNEAGMRDRIIFFVLGALLATMAYVAGDMKNVNADSATVFDKDVLIKGSLVVSGGRIAISDLSKNDKRAYIDCSVKEGLSVIRIVNGQGNCTAYGFLDHSLI